MSWRTGLAAFLITGLLVAGCGDDAGAEPFREFPAYDFDKEPTVVTHDGRPLVINFFAESCAPCVAEMPAFESVFQEMGDRVDFVGVSADATATAGQRIVEATGITYPTVWDRDGSVVTRFEAMGLPTTVFVSATGEIIDVHTGALSETSLTDQVTELLDQT